MDKAEAVELAIKCKLFDGSVDIINLASRLGINVYGSDEDEDFNAEITHLPNNDKFEILVNTKHSLNRQRFSIAHELAHFILHQDRIKKYGSLQRSFNESAPSFDPEIEKQADELAEELLIPLYMLKEDFSEVFKENDITPIVQIQEISRRFKVSLIVVAIRLRKLGCNVPYVSFSYV